jgi:hypothetical protein
MKTISAFLFSALVALAAIAGSVLFLSQVCAVEPAAAPVRSPSRLPIQFERSAPDVKVERAVLTRENLDTLMWKAQATPQAQPQTMSWRKRFLCDIRVTDVLLIGWPPYFRDSGCCGRSALPIGPRASSTRA